MVQQSTSFSYTIHETDYLSFVRLNTFVYVSKVAKTYFTRYDQYTKHIHVLYLE